MKRKFLYINCDFYLKTNHLSICPIPKIGEKPIKKLRAC